MSSISIVQEHNRFTYVVDTAQSCVVNGNIYRIRDGKEIKTHLIGKDVVFMSGSARYINSVLIRLNNFLDIKGHIIVDKLQLMLIKDPSIHADNVCEGIGIVIMQIKEGKTVLKAMKQSYNNFEIITVNTEPNRPPVLSVDGFNNDFYFDKIMENERLHYEKTGSYCILNSILNAYRKNYSEGVGGTLLMYRFDSDGVVLMH